MSKPEKFTLTTDYGTLKNDDSDTIVVTMSSTTVGGSALYSVFQDVAVGTANASSRVRVASSKDSNEFYPGSILVGSRTGTIPGPFSVPYDVVGYTSRISETTVRATIALTNPYSDPLTMTAGNEVFTFDISTYLSPFV